MVRDGRFPHALVAGLGHADRGDDGFGPEVVRALRRVEGVGARLVECREGAAELLDLWAGVDRAWVVDAVRSGSPPGTLHVRDGRSDDLPPEASAASTHGLSLPIVIGVARSVGSLPTALTIVGVEVGSLEAGAGLSAPVRAQVEPVAMRILGELRADRGGGREAVRGGPDA